MTAPATPDAPPGPRMQSLVPMLQTDDMQATIGFYTQTLGFTLAGCHPEEAPGWCSLEHGDVRLMFTTLREHPADDGDRDGADLEAPPRMSGRLYIRTDDVAAIYARVAGAASVIEPMEVYFYGMKEFAIRDNNGYVLAFGEETDEPPTDAENA